MVKYFIYIIFFVLISFNGFSQTLKRYTLNPLGFSNNTIASMGGISIKNDSNSTTLVGYPIPPKLFLDTTVFIQEGLFCTGDSIKLYIKKSPFNKWFENGVLIAENKDTIITKKSATYYAVMEDGFGFTDSTRKINTKFDTFPDITLSLAGDSNFCDGKQTIIRSNRTIGSNLFWMMDGQTISNPNDSLIVKKSGTYFAYVSTQSNCKTFSKNMYKIVVNPLPIAPVVRDTNYCNNASSDTLRFNTSTGATLLWYGTNATGGTGTSIALKPSTANVGIANYYLSQIITATGCEGPRSKVVVITKPLPNAPTISRDTANFLVSGTSATTWYKDGTALTDTAQKYKPASPGSYTAKTTSNGCASIMSSAYYYLVTDVINLNYDEFIKLAPNPFINQLNFDFVVKGYQRLNLEVFDVATGMKKASMQNLTPGMPIYLGQLSTGTYYVRVSSKDGKINYQFKMVKF
jgi:hypothetical protein